MSTIPLYLLTEGNDKEQYLLFRSQDVSKRTMLSRSHAQRIVRHDWKTLLLSRTLKFINSDNTSCMRSAGNSIVVTWFGLIRNDNMVVLSYLSFTNSIMVVLFVGSDVFSIHIRVQYNLGKTVVKIFSFDRCS